jgi:precorrin-2 methylase
MQFSAMIEEALNTEKKALSITAEARSEGAREEAAADKKAADLIKAAKDGAEKAAQAKLQSFEKELAQAKENNSKKIAEEEITFFAKDAPLVQAAADEAYSVITAGRKKHPK